MKISLLHATRGTPDVALATANKWLDRATLPGAVEHIFAIQKDDFLSAKRFEETGSNFVSTDPPVPWASSSVANWNAAAAKSTGDLLVVIADDLLPPEGWDQSLRQLPSDTRHPYACYVPDSFRQDGLMCHPVLSRGLYQKRRYVFHPSFFGVYCDNDFTIRTQLEAPIYVIPDLLWQHEHSSKKSTPPDQNAQIQNSDKAYQYGRAALLKLWPFYAAFEQSIKAGGALGPHLFTLATLARDCDHVTEFGIHNGDSTIAFLHGLSNKNARMRSYHPERIPLIEQLAKHGLQTHWTYHWAEPATLAPIEETDLLLLNTRPIYSQLQRELSLHAAQVRRFLIIPHTERFAKTGADSGPGLTRALLDWVTRQPHWKIEARSPEHGGLTVLKRCPPNP
jgi:hypothetical protein